MDTPKEKQVIPWQDRKNLGFFRALFETIKQVLFQPADFFDNLEVKDAYLEPFSFCFIITGTIMIISVIFEMFSKKGTSPLEFLFTLLLSLVFLSIAIFLGAAMIHLCVLLFRGKGGFKGTFNVLAYNAATGIFIIVPVLGGLVSLVWASIVGVIGLKRIHQFNTTKAVFAYLGIPIAVMALLFAIAIPNLSRTRLTANESAVEATLRTISTAIETYAVTNKGKYPLDEYDLLYSTPPYFKNSYNNETIQGYRYSLNFLSDGYKVVATPQRCAVTGNNIFIIETKGKLSKEPCK